MENLQRKKFGLIRARTVVLVSLLVLPLVVYAVVGTIAVWQIGWLGWLWWLIPVFWLATWLIARFWRASPEAERKLLGATHWTPRDEQAAEIVRQFQNQVDQFDPADLTDLHLHLNQAQSLANALAKHYHPDSADPISSLTVPEILAAIRLVADDLEGLLLQSVPGSRSLTVGQWKKLGNAPKWIRNATNAVWAASILFNPANIARYGTSRITNDRVVSGLQTEFLVTVYLRFIRQVGFYLIEMNSGRLRGGADLYKETFEDANRLATDETPDKIPSVRIALIGQTGAGKSSLINALIGKSSAEVDILPATTTNRGYEFKLPQESTRVSLLDTPGYAQDGATTAQLTQIKKALEQCDAVLLILDAHTPAREADRKTMERLHAHFEKNPSLKPPPVIAVLTHIDLLSPSMEWNPPYDWQSGTRPKETNIAAAVDYTREIFGEWIVEVVPVCSQPDNDRQWGIVSNLLPQIITHLDQARSVAILSMFEKSLNQDKLKILIRQATRSGKQMIQSWLEERFHRG